MFDPYVEAALSRQHDLLLEAERDRIILYALSSSAGRAGRGDQALVWLGGRLEQWGRRLQARSGYNNVSPRGV